MTAIELLDFIIILFKKSKDNNEIFKELSKQDIICSSFEKKYLLNNVDFEFELVKIVPKTQNLMECYLEANDGSPYKMELIFEKKWYLKSFLFQCQSCFGIDEECSVCGGSGWGVL